MTTMKSNHLDVYLQEYSGIIHSAFRIIKKQIERDALTTPMKVAEAMMRIPNVEKFATVEKRIKEIKRISSLIKTAAIRGAFPGYQFSPKCGIYEVHINVPAESDKQALLQMKVWRTAYALADYLGMKNIQPSK